MKIKGEITKDGMPSLELDAGQEELSSFFGSLLPTFVKEIGGILTDQVKYIRFVNQVNIVRKAKAIIDKEGFMMKDQTPLKTLAPIMEHGSMEEEESMQEKWANMLVNATTGNKTVRPNYPEILKGLTTVEVKVLDYLFNESNASGKMKEKKFTKEFLAKDSGVLEEDIDLIIEDLIRFNLIRYAPKEISWEDKYYDGLTVRDFDAHMASLFPEYRTNILGAELVNDMYPKKNSDEDENATEIKRRLENLQEKLSEMGVEDRSSIKMTALGFHFVNACQI